MKRLLLAPLAVLFFAASPALQIVVNSSTLPVPALEQHSRVLVPMRALFEALGAGVVYSPATRTIVAKGHDRRIELLINSPRADVDGASILLDASPKIIGARTFVPLRFVAQTLGANVAYDNTLRIVTVSLPTQRAAAAQAVSIVSMQPNDGSSLASGYPTIRAEILNPPPNRRPEIALYLDNNDVTSLASFDGRIITYVPRSSLSNGRHTVTFSGDYDGSDPFIRTWSFTNSLSYQNTSTWPSMYNQFGFQLMGSPYVAAGQYLQFLLTGPAYGSAYLQPCYGNQLIPFTSSSNGYYYANLQAPYVDSYYRCPVTAIFYDQFGNATYLPYPAYFNVNRNYNPQPTPRPYVTLPPQTPRPLPTPTPTPATRHILPIGPPTALPSSLPTRRPIKTPVPKRIILPIRRGPTLYPHPVQPKATMQPKPAVKVTPTPHVAPKSTIAPKSKPKPKFKPKPKATPH